MESTENMLMSLNTMLTMGHKPHSANPAFTEILRLANLLRDYEYTAYKLQPLFDGWQIVFYDADGVRRADVVQHAGSYGAQANLLESMGFPEDMDDVTGYLHAEDILRQLPLLQ